MSGEQEWFESVITIVFALMMVLVILFVLIPDISAGEVRNIEYTLNVSFEPYCVNNVCVNETLFHTDNATNITINYTRETCSSVCYGILKVDGIYENQLFFEIDTGSERWKNGSSELRYGYKSADLGNLSDISGIRQELQNLTTCFMEHLICTANLTECSTENKDLDIFLIDKDNKIEELNKKENDKYTWLIGGLVIGALFIWKGWPALKGTRNPKDPSTSQFPSNVGNR